MIPPEESVPARGGAVDPRPDPDAPTVHDVVMGRHGPDGAPRAADRRLERSSTVLLRIGATLVSVFVMLPVAGLAAILLYAQSYQRWPLGGGDMTVEFRLQLLSVTLLLVGAVVACAVVLWRSLRRGSIALALVGLGGLACIYIGVRGIIEATVHDITITGLSCGLVATGVVLVLGASLGMAARVRAAHLRPG
jgi:hypothetical protein